MFHTLLEDKTVGNKTRRIKRTENIDDKVVDMLLVFIHTKGLDEELKDFARAYTENRWDLPF